MLGGFLALLSAATFAFNNAAVRRGVLSGSVAQAMAITVPMGLPIFLLGVVLFGAYAPFGEFTLATWGWLALAGVQHFILGRYCNYRATKAMGAVLTGPVQQSGTVFTLLIAVLVLGETLTPLQILGIGLIVLGPMLCLRAAKEHKSSKEPAVVGAGNDETVQKVAENVRASAAPVDVAKTPFKPKYVEGYFNAIVSAAAQGTSPILIRFALEDKGLSASIAGGLISYGAATLLFCLILLWPGQARHVMSVNREAGKWFVISGLFVGFSQLFRYMALAVAPVTVVTPIQRLSLLFRLYFARLLSRDHEVLGGRVILGTIVSLVGTLALSVSTDLVLDLVPLPDFIVAIAQWRWP
ncbi:MAG: EamA family transporter [Alphaproteobacteria bacterium]